MNDPSCHYSKLQSGERFPTAASIYNTSPKFLLKCPSNSLSKLPKLLIKKVTKNNKHLPVSNHVVHQCHSHIVLATGNGR